MTPAEYLKAVKNSDQTVNPLLNLLGATVIETNPGEATLKLPTNPGFAQGAGVVSGGILATLLDETMAHAVLGCLPADCTTATVNMNVCYHRQTKVGDELLCTARTAKQGQRVIFVEAEITVAGKSTATATASFIVTHCPNDV